MTSQLLLASSTGKPIGSRSNLSFDVRCIRAESPRPRSGCGLLCAVYAVETEPGTTSTGRARTASGSGSTATGPSPRRRARSSARFHARSGRAQRSSRGRSQLRCRPGRRRRRSRCARSRLDQPDRVQVTRDRAQLLALDVGIPRRNALLCGVKRLPDSAVVVRRDLRHHAAKEDDRVIGGPGRLTAARAHEPHGDARADGDEKGARAERQPVFRTRARGPIVLGHEDQPH